MRVQEVRTSVSALLQLFSFLFDQAIKLIKQLAICFANSINDAGKDRLHRIRAVSQQSVNKVFSNPLLKLLPRHSRQVDKSAADLSSRKQLFLEETIQSGHH